MNCPSCEHVVHEQARFCEKCGSILHATDLGLSHKLAYAYRLEVTGEFEEASREYEGLLESGPDGPETAAVRKHLGNLHFRLGHLRRARAHLVRACELDPDNPALWHDLGVVHYHGADFEQAAAAFEQALARADTHLSYFWLGNARYHLGDLEGARQAFAQLVERFPNFTIARFHLGVIFARKGDKQQAEAEFRRVLSKNPEAAAARFYVSP